MLPDIVSCSIGSLPRVLSRGRRGRRSAGRRAATSDQGPSPYPAPPTLKDHGLAHRATPKAPHHVCPGVPGRSRGYKWKEWYRGCPVQGHGAECHVPGSTISPPWRTRPFASACPPGYSWTGVSADAPVQGPGAGRRVSADTPSPPRGNGLRTLEPIPGSSSTQGFADVPGRGRGGGYRAPSESTLALRYIRRYIDLDLRLHG